MDHVILEREALRLPAGERALLADALLGSLEDEACHEVLEAWAAETERRLDSYHRGEVAAHDGPAVLARLRAQHAA